MKSTVQCLQVKPRRIYIRPRGAHRRRRRRRRRSHKFPFNPCLCNEMLGVRTLLALRRVYSGKIAERGDVARGLGLIGSAFGLAIIFGPVLGGSLSENYRSEACFVSSALLALSVLSCFVYGWKETAPEVLSPQPASPNSASSGGTSKRKSCSALWLVNPFSVLKVFLVHRYNIFVQSCSIFWKQSRSSIVVDIDHHRITHQAVRKHGIFSCFWCPACAGETLIQVVNDVSPVVAMIFVLVLHACCAQPGVRKRARRAAKVLLAREVHMPM